MKNLIRIGTSILMLLFLCHGLKAQMPPISLSTQDLPYNIEGHTTSEGTNILSSGGIHVDIDLVKDLHGPVNRYQHTIESGQPYMLKLRVSKGRDFDSGKRMVDNLWGPKSQVIMHLPGSAEITGPPKVYVDGITVSQQLVHNLWTTAGLGMPAAAPIGHFVTYMILNAITGAIGDNVIDAAYENFLANEIIEVADEIDFGDNKEVKQVVWQLGGWEMRDNLSVQTAEIYVPVKFTKDGHYDLSLYLNLWGRHNYADRSDWMTGTIRGLDHSFRQQIVIGVEVDQGQEAYSEDERGGIFTDSRDGQSYRWVRIGDQVWMAENLRYFPSVSGSGGGSATRPYFYVYGYEGTSVQAAEATDNYQNYGALYNWPAALNACPLGWHLPSDTEWTQLVDYVVAQGYSNREKNTNGAGNALKSCRQVGSSLSGECDTYEHPRWSSHDIHKGFDAFGFSALPGGHRIEISGGEFSGIGRVGFWWSSTPVTFKNKLALPRGIFQNYGDVFRDFNYDRSRGFSVRCIRD